MSSLAAPPPEQLRPFTSPMARVPLAVGGLSFSQLAAGCWRLLEQSGGDPNRIELFVETALANGITTFDHADLYGDYGVETAFGDLLRRRPALRDQMEIVTKCGIAPVSDHWPERHVLYLDNSASFIQDSVDRSLIALGTDYIDVFLLHRPDLLTDPDEIAEAFAVVERAGKVLAFGVSNFRMHQFDLLQSRLPNPLVTNQIELSVLESGALDDGRLSGLQALGRPAMAWSPFSGGQLFTSSGDREKRLRAALNVLAEKYAVSPAAVALAWVLRLPGSPIPILGSSAPERIDAMAKAGEICLEHQDWYFLAAQAGRFIA